MAAAESLEPASRMNRGELHEAPGGLCQLVGITPEATRERLHDAVDPPRMGATSRYVHRPAADKLNRAMPHVRSMLTAMRDRDRTTALAHGGMTLQRL
jgi:hypothetical protein